MLLERFMINDIGKHDVLTCKGIMTGFTEIDEIPISAIRLTIDKSDNLVNQKLSVESFLLYREIYKPFSNSYMQEIYDDKEILYFIVVPKTKAHKKLKGTILNKFSNSIIEFLHDGVELKIFDIVIPMCGEIYNAKL